MDRNLLFLADIHLTDKIIEIGPSIAPVAPKSAGWNVTVVDHASQAELKGKYRDIVSKESLDAIEEVDVIWRGGALHSQFPEEAYHSFKRVIASHALEHFPDPILFFSSASKLLFDSGSISLAIPDKRHCFDVFKPLTTTVEWISSHLDKNGVHSPNAIFNHLAFYTEKNKVPSWDKAAISDLRLSLSVPYAYSSFLDYKEKTERDYIDVHAWAFTPASFELIIFELGLLKLIDWEIVSNTQLSPSEFVCTFEKATYCNYVDDEANEKRRNLMAKAILEMAVVAQELLDESAEDAVPKNISEQLDKLVRDVQSISRTQEDINRILGVLKKIWHAGRSVKRLFSR